MNDRPLWRTGTKQAIRRLREQQDVQRAFLQECDLTLLLAEVVARGYHVTPPMVKLGGGEDGVPEERDADPWDTIEGLIGSVDAPSGWSLGKKWPPLADDDD